MCLETESGDLFKQHYIISSNIKLLKKKKKKEYVESCFFPL